MTSDLTPVPKGMCPAFYQFMGAGGQRSDSGEILMLKESPMTSNPTPDRPSDVEAAAAEKTVPMCAFCGRPATCFGCYEGTNPELACDLCCGHAGEDGWCEKFPSDAASIAILETKVNELLADLAAARAEVERLQDHSEADCTDAAHPAWWRGHDHGAESICREAARILDGGEIHGVCAEPWESVRRRLHELTSQAAAFASTEPVTEEWLRSIGFTDDPDRVWLQFITPQEIEITWWRSDGEVSISNATNGIELGTVTRGRILHLLAAIGGAK